MAKGRIRHMFPGGNTSKGFFSYYDYILTQDEAVRIFTIKGGPGVGKSTFMKHIGKEMLEHGYDVEFMHCSSDNNSLDGVVIPGIKVALLDGTAPHVVDPKNPGAVDEIINLGDYWDESGIVQNREDIIEVNKEVGRLFARAYKYLKAASCVYDDMSEIYNLAFDRQKVNAAAHKLVREIFCDRELSTYEGKQRKLFASAITPAGLKNYLESILVTEKVYVLESCPGVSTELMLNMIKNAAVERGYYTECYYCALFPEKLEHIVVPEMDISFTTENKYHTAEVKEFERFDFRKYLDGYVVDKYSDVLGYDMAEFERLLERAVYTIKKAKAAHDGMEQYYIPNMDFEAVQCCREVIMNRILGY